MKKALIVACKQIEGELEELVRQAGCPYPVLYLPRELHLSPDNLRAYLQELLERVGNVDYVVLPTGQCGNGTIGLTCPHASLVIPRCTDCIDTLLSTSAGLCADRPTHSYFLTGSWLEGAHSVLAEYEYSKAKYSPEQVASILEMCYGNYEDFTFVDTGAYDVAAAQARVEGLASDAGLGIVVREGECGILRKLLAAIPTGGFDDDFIVVEPGVEVTQAHFQR